MVPLAAFAVAPPRFPHPAGGWVDWRKQERERHAVDAGVLGRRSRPIRPPGCSSGWRGPTRARCSRIPPERRRRREHADDGARRDGGRGVWAEGSRDRPGVLLAPFAMGLAAAFLGRYPYGGYRTMQYVAPSIILMTGLGAAGWLARLPGPYWRTGRLRLGLFSLAAVGIGMMAWDATHPYMSRLDQDSPRHSPGGSGPRSRPGPEIVCARTDLRLLAEHAGLARRPRGDVPVLPGDRFAPTSPQDAPAFDRVSNPIRSESWCSTRPRATRRPSPVGSARMRAVTSCVPGANGS